MNQAGERISALRAAMKEQGVDGYLIPSSDPHMSEYLPDYYQSRSWFSGFNGSAGTLAVTADKAALWTDGRYFIQAERQLSGSGIELMRMGRKETPQVSAWLAENLPQNGVMGVDGMVTATAMVRELEKAFEKKGASVRNVDLVTPLWQKRPALPSEKAWLLDLCYAGKTAGEKLGELREKLKEQGAGGMLVSRLDSVAWLLNLRAADVEDTPFALAYCLVLLESATLFLGENRLAEQDVQELAQQGVAVRPYGEAVAALREIASPVTMLYEESGLNYALYGELEQNGAITPKAGEEPVQALKGVKNEVEIENLRASHKKDGVAMVRFQMDLERRMAAGETVTECAVSDRMREQRAAQPLNIGESFGTIAAYGANAAMMHYHPTPENCAVLEPHGFLLVDCGGQYLDGTTDITRTYALGELTQEEKTWYTLVLKSHIALARAVFLEGCTGSNLDILARNPVWQHGIDYRCGTGHGVGFVGGVHEGPQNISMKSHTAFVPGMTVTDEPGIYEEGRVGIRIENELLCKEWGVNEYGRFLCFEPFTYCPIDTAPIELSLLATDEMEWLNKYHQTVYDTLESSLTPEEQAWLRRACAPLAR